MTRDEFEQFLTRNVTEQIGVSAPMVVVEPPWAIVPCRCGDVNCRGWRVRHVAPPSLVEALQVLRAFLRCAAVSRATYATDIDLATAADRALALIERTSPASDTEGLA